MYNYYKVIHSHHKTPPAKYRARSSDADSLESGSESTGNAVLHASVQLSSSTRSQQLEVLFEITNPTSQLLSSNEIGRKFPKST